MRRIIGACLLCALVVLLSGCEHRAGVLTTQNQLWQHIRDGYVEGRQTFPVMLLQLDSTEHAQRAAKTMIRCLRAQKSHTRSMPIFTAETGMQAVQYMAGHCGTNNALMLATTASLMQLGEDADLLMQSVQRIADIAVENNCIIVRADAPWKTLDQLVQALRDGERITVGLNAHRSEYDRYYAEHFFAACGIRTMPGQREIQEDLAMALLRADVDVLCVCAYDVLPLLQSGELRALASMGSSRLDVDVLREVPTLIESGYDLTDGNVYTLYCPKDYPQINGVYWEHEISRLLANEDWSGKLRAMCLSLPSQASDTSPVRAAESDM